MDRPTGGRWSRHGVAAVPAWTIATILSMVVATVGVQEIASRVADPLNLDGRSEDVDAAPIELAARESTRVGQTAAEPRDGVTPDVDETDAVSTGSTPVGTDAAAFVPAIPAPPPPPAGSWDTEDTGGTQTRWAPGGPDDTELWRLEYQALGGEWEQGYADNADVALTSPWLDVPAQVERPGIGLWARVSIEPGYDVLHVQWRGSPGAPWEEVGRVSTIGGDALRLHEFGLPADADADRLQVRLRLTSDVAGSSAPPVAVEGLGIWIEGLAVREVGAPVTALGQPRRSLVQEVPGRAHAVVAVTGDGIQPYHREFRDDSPRAWAHPSTYLDGYPQDATALWLSLDAPSLEEALERDAAIWEAVEPGRLYWVPGTRVIGMRAAVGGLQICTGRDAEQNLTVDGACALDHGANWWGTAAASLAVGATFGSCPDCLLVSHEGIGGDAASWVAEHRSWIDVHAIVEYSQLVITALSPWRKEIERLREAASETLVLAPVGGGVTDEVAGARAIAGVSLPANGNNRSLFAPAPGEWSWPGGIPGVVAVGHHDHGHVTGTQSASPELIAPGCELAVARGTMSGRSDVNGVGPRYAVAEVAGRLAAATLEVRRTVGAAGAGLVDGALVATSSRTPGGPLADGRLEPRELLEVARATATVPAAGEQRCGHDGEYHTTAPVPAASLPAEARPPVIGWGELLGASEIAEAVLSATLPPPRAAERTWHAERERQRELWFAAFVALYGIL